MTNFFTTFTEIIDTISAFLVSFAESVVPADIFNPAQEMVSSTLTDIAPVWNEFWGALGDFIF
jgi:hypothetical protein